VADFGIDKQVHMSQAYTKGEVLRAMKVRELQRVCGYPSYQELIYMLQDGSVAGMPNLTSQDVHRAYQLYGSAPEFVRGRMTNRRVTKAVVDDGLLLEEKKAILHTDVMQIDSQRFLITVCNPLQITLQVPIERESQAVLGMALQGQLGLIRSKGFQPVRVYVDPQSALRALATKFENVVIDVGGAGDHLPKVDAKIRRIKERYRSVKASLPWQLPMSLVKDLVAFVVSRINMERSAAINLNVAPKVLFTGMKSDFKKEFSLAFGDYCEVYDGTDNTSRERSVLCIALYPCNNAAGSWAFLNLKSKQQLRRTQWIKMVTNEEIVKQMNAYDGLELQDVAAVLVEHVEPEEQQLQEAEARNEGELEAPEGTLEGVTLAQDEECPELEPQGDDDESDDEAEEETVLPEVRRSERIKAEVEKPKRYAAATVKLRSGRHNSEDRNKKIEEAQRAEIKQVFEELDALEPLKREALPQGIKALGMHLFTIEKFTASGEHEKFKS
jgi:hypothetical protein